MQRPEAKNPPERPLLSTETGNVEIGVKNPRRNGPFLIDDGFRSSGRLDGGGCSRAKPVSNAGTGNFSKISGQNRLSERLLAVSIRNSPVTQISYTIVQAPSCYSAKQAI